MTGNFCSCLKLRLGAVCSTCNMATYKEHRNSRDIGFKFIIILTWDEVSSTIILNLNSSLNAFKRGKPAYY